MPVETPVQKYLFCLAVVVVFAVLAKNLVRGAIGREWMAIRDMDVAASVIGIRPMYAKLTAFAGGRLKRCVSMRARASGDSLGVTGWVRNRRDGTVEAVVDGVAAEALLAWARRGPPSARVTDVTVSETEGSFERFEMRPTA